MSRRVSVILLSPLLIGCRSTEVKTEGLSAEDLADRTVHRRGVEAVIWGMPAVNAELMFDAMKDAGADFNQVVYWSRPVSWKNQTLTPNPDTIYLMPFYNTKDVGPMVLEIPPASENESITGSVDDGWQTAIEDVGPAGVDKGKGGKYLILPPDYKEKVPDGYIPMPSVTYAGYALLRSNLASGSEADIARAVAYGRQIKFYPLSQGANPPETKFVDAIDILFDSTIPYDVRFFQALDRFVQREPWLERDKAMIDQLKTIGIEKSKQFSPDASTQKILTDSAGEAHAWLDHKYEGIFSPPFNEGTHWQLPAAPGLGEGQFYLMTIVDKDGNSFGGSSNYRRRVPPNAPVKLYWSATLYDRATHALIRNQQWSSRSSHTPGLEQNPDDSVDIYFGPKAPVGKESNWIPTNGYGKFEVLFRLYGPEKALFEKTWMLPDIEKTK